MSSGQVAVTAQSESSGELYFDSSAGKTVTEAFTYSLDFQPEWASKKQCFGVTGCREAQRDCIGVPQIL